MNTPPPTEIAAVYPQGLADFKTRVLDIDELHPHPRNPRKHPDKDTPEYDVLLASLRYDYFDPIVWNVRNGLLVSGHLRSKVLKDMGVAQARVVEVDYDEPTHLARMIAANKQMGKNNDKSVAELLKELEGVSDFDMELSGFTPDEIDEFASKNGTGEPGFDFNDDASQAPSAPPPVSAYGEQTGGDTIRFFTLIFPVVDFERFKEMVEAVKAKDAVELTRKFGERAGDMPNILMHVAETLMP